MKQPIFVINKSKVKEIVEHQSKFTQIPYWYEWGKVKSLDQLLNEINNIQCVKGTYIKMHDLHLCFQNLETQKIPAYANRMIHRVLALCKNCREDLNKISVEQ
jgi:hypothetical protein